MSNAQLLDIADPVALSTGVSSTSTVLSVELIINPLALSPSTSIDIFVPASIVTRSPVPLLGLSLISTESLVDRLSTKLKS